MSSTADRGTIDERTRDHFARWPGLLSLSVGVLTGPTVALVSMGIIYVSNAWACGVRSSLALHLIPLFCLAAAVGAGLLAYADWKRVGRGARVDEATVGDRTRFLALIGMGASAISALVIVAQWLAIFVFGPCMRA
jgi:hypothetical protein